MNFRHETIDDQWTKITHRDGKSYGLCTASTPALTVGAVHLQLTARDGSVTLHELDLTYGPFFSDQVRASAAVFLSEEGHVTLSDDHQVTLVRVDSQNADGSYAIHDMEGQVLNAEYSPA